MTINNERLAKFEGKCWHKLEFDGTAMTRWIGPWTCKHCGKRFEVGKPDNPSYSTSPADRERLWLYLMGKEEMWMQFYIWSHEKKEQGDCNRVIYDWPFVSWLFSPLDGVPRWVSLLSEWLGMESTREKFGWVECPQYTPDTDELVSGITG